MLYILIHIVHYVCSACTTLALYNSFIIIFLQSSSIDSGDGVDSGRPTVQSPNVSWIRASDMLFHALHYSFVEQKNIESGIHCTNAECTLTLCRFGSMRDTFSNKEGESEVSQLVVQVNRSLIFILLF